MFNYLRGLLKRSVTHLKVAYHYAVNHYSGPSYRIADNVDLEDALRLCGQGSEPFELALTTVRIMDSLPSHQRWLVSLLCRASGRDHTQEMLEEMCHIGILSKASLSQGLGGLLRVKRLVWKRRLSLWRRRGRKLIRSHPIGRLFFAGRLWLTAFKCELIRLSLRHFIGHKASEETTIEKRKTLVIVIGGVGDLILASPVIRELVASGYTDELDVLVYSAFSDFYNNCPYVSQTIAVERRVPLLPSLPTRTALFKSIAANEYHTVISLFDHFECYPLQMTGKAIAYLSGAAVRVGSMDPMFRRIFPRSSHYLTFCRRFRREHEVKRGLSLVKSLGTNIQNDRLEVWCEENDVKEAYDLLASHGLMPEEGCLIGIAPFTSGMVKAWPLQCWRRLLLALDKEIPCTYVILGSPEERVSGTLLADFSGCRVVNLCGKTSLRTWTAVIRRCDLLISVDTGAAHCAAALNVPQVALFAHTDPHICGPWKNLMARIVTPSDGTRKMSHISDEAVLAATLELVAELSKVRSHR